MKTPLFLAAAVLAASLSAPALAHTVPAPHVHAGSAGVLLGPTVHRPVWAYRIDPGVLYPIPGRIPVPIPGPGCLSCPPMPLDERVTTPQLIMR